MKFLLPIFLFFLFFPSVSFSEKKPKGLVRLISIDGEISDKKLRILHNKLYESLGKHFLLIPRDVFYKTKQEVMSELGKDTCDSYTCLPLIQKKGQFHLACFHQIQLSKSKNFFHFQFA